MVKPLIWIKIFSATSYNVSCKNFRLDWNRIWPVPFIFIISGRNNNSRIQNSQLQNVIELKWVKVFIVVASIKWENRCVKQNLASCSTDNHLGIPVCVLGDFSAEFWVIFYDMTRGTLSLDSYNCNFWLSDVVQFFWSYT